MGFGVQGAAELRLQLDELRRRRERAQCSRDREDLADRVGAEVTR
jgi:hypothetical protein